MRKIITILMCLITYITLTSQSGCNDTIISNPESASGVKKMDFRVPVDIDGKTIEQVHVADRMTQDNKPGAIQHLYVISAYSGQVLIYSTVKGKVTSSGKRLSPSTVDGHSGIDAEFAGSRSSISGYTANENRVTIGDNNYVTNEVLGDDGTYGSSVEYIYWWDSKGIYHSHYPSGGQIIHISSQPLSVKSIILNFEKVNEESNIPSNTTTSTK